MPHQDHGQPTGFTEAFLQLHRLAGEPRASQILERAAALRLVDESIRALGAPPADSTVDGWLRNGRVPRREKHLLLVVRVLTRMARERDRPRSVPAHLTEPDAWRRRLAEKADGPPHPGPGAFPEQPVGAVPAPPSAPSAPVLPVADRRRVLRRPALLVLAPLVALAGVLWLTHPWGSDDRDPTGDAGSTRVKDRAVGVENKDSAGAPVKVVSVGRLNTGNNSWAFEDPRTLSTDDLAAIGNQTSQAHYDSWFLERDAVPVGQRQDQILLEGNSDRTVRVVGLEIDKKCRKPLDGTLFYNPNAGQDTSVILTADLDQQFPLIGSTDPESDPDEAYFDSHSISLRKGEQIRVVLLATTNRQYCEYSVDLRIAHGDETLTQTVKDNGRPFRLTADPAGSTDDPHYLSAYRKAYIAGVVAASACRSDVDRFLAVDPRTFTSDTVVCS
ncbi:hypothetical protein ACIPSE_10685 [Streptomyces sp. NPDC090106]|uniref:hypothetical protein n=1 Tax=Streptomyces sp. NPDC090106 TaxID=3365946 RepID=UPI00381D1FA1